MTAIAYQVTIVAGLFAFCAAMALYFHVTGKRIDAERNTRQDPAE